jgi:acyl-CoA reductase-like NAD-dependent aldehyde dehydrogenase
MGFVDGGTIRCIDPRTGSPSGEVLCTPVEDIENLVATARAAQQDWADLLLKERKRAVGALHAAFLARSADIAQALAADCGRPAGEAWTAEIVANHELFGFWLSSIDDLLTATPVQLNPINYPGKRGTVRLLPLGVLGLITPWNLPVAIPLRALIPAILAGNSVVWKGSEHSPRTAALLAELCAQCLPPGVVTLVQGDGAQGAALVDADIDAIFFTGSVKTGRSVGAKAAARGIPSALELGGKDAALVLADADLDRAAQGITWAAFGFAGQNCAAVERCYVHRDVYEQFLAKVVARTQALRPMIDVGPLVTEAQLATVQRHLAEAVAAGAKVQAGCTAAGPGFYHPPTVLTELSEDMVIMREETFGPLLPVCVFDDFEQVITRINSTDFGLTTSIWTRDIELGEAMAERFDCGVVTVNNHSFTGALASAAWGGVKDSGHGTTNSRFSLYEMTRPKTVVVDTSSRPEVWWFPYNEALLRVTQGVIGLATKGQPKLRALNSVISGLRDRFKEEK